MRTAPTTGLYVVEWSKQQNALHVQTMDKATKDALNRFLANETTSGDYVVVYVGDEEKAHFVANQLRPYLASREAARLEKAGS